MNNDTIHVMDQDTLRLVAQLKNISLTDSERHVLQARLDEYVDFHPARPITVGNTGPHGGMFADVIRKFRGSKVATTFASMVIVIGVGAGTSWAAEGALPGDALYAVKINVNENVRSALAFSPESRARLETQLAHHRVEEAVALATKGELTAERGASLAAHFEAHVAQSEGAAHTLESIGHHTAALTARAELDASLAADAQIIANLTGHAMPANRAIDVSTGIPVDNERRGVISAPSSTSVTLPVEHASGNEPNIESSTDKAPETPVNTESHMMEIKTIIQDVLPGIF